MRNYDIIFIGGGGLFVITLTSLVAYINKNKCKIANFTRNSKRNFNKYYIQDILTKKHLNINIKSVSKDDISSTKNLILCIPYNSIESFFKNHSFRKDVSIYIVSSFILSTINITKNVLLKENIKGIFLPCRGTININKQKYMLYPGSFALYNLSKKTKFAKIENINIYNDINDLYGSKDFILREVMNIISLFCNNKKVNVGELLFIDKNYNDLIKYCERHLSLKIINYIEYFKENLFKDFYKEYVPFVLRRKNKKYQEINIIKKELNILKTLL